MLLTNQQIENAIGALEALTVDCPFRAMLRLNRNLRHLIAARQAKNFDVERLRLGVIKDKTRKVEGPLTVQETEELNDLYQELMRTEVEVEIHPLELFNSEQGQQPKDPETAIDISKIERPARNRLLNPLVDVVFVECVN